MASRWGSCGWSPRPDGTLDTALACHNGSVTSRREFLTSASLLLAGAACRGGGSPSVQTFPSTFVTPGNQTLEQHLVIASPQGQIDAQMLQGFAARTGVECVVQAMATGDELLLRLAAGDFGQVDLALVDFSTLSYLIDAGQVEPLARKLLPNQSRLQQPFDDSPIDRGLRHSVPASYDIVGVSVAAAAPIEADTWLALFAMAERHPGQVLVPDSADQVIGAVLVSLGHPWDSDSNGDLGDAHDRLAELRPALHVLGARQRSAGRVSLLPVLGRLASSHAYRSQRRGERFFVPGEGSAVDLRSYCIPVYAPHPVVAHAWLENWLDPSVEAPVLARSRVPVPLLEARASLPGTVLDNQAVCPPSEALAASVQPNISAEGRLLRDQIWTELHL
ncbi:MAG: spermidine/putrescine transport system substrate-binding protein [Gaiellales bacterium]|nr:spermidine/putrescine transport system substrate-binding protein [Gaiellales bacterium]